MKKQNNLKISVITPVYNQELLVAETIKSVLEQDYQNFEYIVIDDGSSDKSLTIVNRFKKNKKIRIYTQKNMGEAKTVNRGFDLARGEIVVVVSSDDPLYPRAISEAVNFFTNNPDIDIAYPDWDMIDETGKKIKHIKTYEYSYINMLRWHHCFPGPAAFIRKKIIKQLNGRDPYFKYVGDYDFWLRAGLIGKFARIPKTLAKYRVHLGSATVSSAGKYMADEHIKLVRRFYNLPDTDQGLFKYKNEAFSSAHYVAAVSSGDNLVFERIKHVLLAFLYKPFKYLGEYRYRAKLIFNEVFKKKRVKQETSKEPLVSVIIPFFNRLDWVNLAIKSVLNQTYKNFEIILINDGSAQDTRDHIDLKNPKIHYYFQKNQGPAAARNLGIEKAQGEYIAFLDSDDLFLPNKLKVQIAMMQKNPQMNLSHTSFLYMDSSGKNLMIRNSGKLNGRVYPWIALRCPIATPTVVLKRSILNNLRFNKSFKQGEDVLLWCEIARISPILGIDKPSTKVRRHGEHTALIPFDKKISVSINVINHLRKTEKNKIYRLILFFFLSGLKILKHTLDFLH